MITITDKVKAVMLIVLLLFAGLWVERLFAAAEARGELRVHLAAATADSLIVVEAGEKARLAEERAVRADSSYNQIGEELREERAKSERLLRLGEERERIQNDSIGRSLRDRLPKPLLVSFDSYQAGWMRRLDAKDDLIALRDIRISDEHALTLDALRLRDNWREAHGEKTREALALEGVVADLRLAINASERARAPLPGFRFKSNTLTLGLGVVLGLTASKLFGGD